MGFIKQAWACVWPKKAKPVAEPVLVFQLRAQGPAQSVRGDIMRVDNIVYSSIEMANAEIPRFRREVTRLVPSMYNSISPDACRIDAYPMPIDNRGLTVKE